jgi:hypothetical protein
MGTGLMQWTADSSIDVWNARLLLRLCKFMLVCAFTMEMDANWPHPTHQPWFLVSNFAIRKLVLIYIHKKETKDSQRSSCLSQFLLFVMFCLVPFFCHELFGAISIITRPGTCAHVHLFWTMFGDPSVDPTDPQNMAWHINIVHHHDESLLLWWMWEQTH